MIFIIPEFMEKKPLHEEMNSEEIELMDKQDHEFAAYRQVLFQISHDLRTPAAILKSNFPLIKDFQYKLCKSSRIESFSTCESALENLINFLDKIQLLNISLHPNLKPFKQEFKAKSLLRGLFKDEKVSTGCRRLKISWNLIHPVIYSDYRFLQQTISHLLSNALKFSTHEVRLMITVSQDRVQIVIKDQGIGIPAEEQQTVFNSFYRASNSYTFPGAGMGLAIVRRLVKALDAELFLSSKVNAGTVIKIILNNKRA
jgi:signal transduction histidine kinase